MSKAIIPPDTSPIKCPHTTFFNFEASLDGIATIKKIDAAKDENTIACSEFSTNMTRRVMIDAVVAFDIHERMSSVCPISSRYSIIKLVYELFSKNKTNMKIQSRKEINFSYTLCYTQNSLLKIVNIDS